MQGKKRWREIKIDRISWKTTIVFEWMGAFNVEESVHKLSIRYVKI